MKKRQFIGTFGTTLLMFGSGTSMMRGEHAGWSGCEMGTKPSGCANNPGGYNNGPDGKWCVTQCDWIANSQPCNPGAGSCY